MTSYDEKVIELQIEKNRRGPKTKTFLYNYTTYKITNNTIAEIQKLNYKNTHFLQVQNELLNLKLYDEPLLKMFFKYKKSYSNEELSNIVENKLPIENDTLGNETKAIYTLECFLQRKELKEQIVEERHLYESEIFEDFEIEEIRNLINQEFNEGELFNTVFNRLNVNGCGYIKLSILKKLTINIDNYENISIFPEIDYESPKLVELPFNQIGIQPKAAYPFLANKMILPFTDKQYSYGNIKISNHQQFEISSCERHSAYYYRKARVAYKVSTPFLYDSILLQLIKKYGSIDSDVLKTLHKGIRECPYKDDNTKKLFYEMLYYKSLITPNLNDLKEELKSLFPDEKFDLKSEMYFKLEDLDIYGNPVPENHIVAKRIENIRYVTELGLATVLNDDINFPIELASYHPDTPHMVYLPLIENNKINKGLYSHDGKIHNKWLKRARVLYIPDFYLEKKEKVFVDKNNFKIPKGRAISDLPILAYSYIILPMSIKDKIAHFNKNQK